MLTVFTPSWWDDGEQHIGLTDGMDTYCCSAVPCWWVEVPEFEYWGYFQKKDLTVVERRSCDTELRGVQREVG